MHPFSCGHCAPQLVACCISCLCNTNGATSKRLKHPLLFSSVVDFEGWLGSCGCGRPWCVHNIFVYIATQIRHCSRQSSQSYQLCICFSPNINHDFLQEIIPEVSQPFSGSTRWHDCNQYPSDLTTTRHRRLSTPNR